MKPPRKRLSRPSPTKVDQAIKLIPPKERES